MDTPDKLNVREEMDKERDELLQVLADRLTEEMKALTRTALEMNVVSLPTVLKAWSMAGQRGLQQQLAEITESTATLLTQLQAAGVKRTMTPVLVVGMDEYLATGNEALLEKQLADITRALREGARARLVLHQAMHQPPDDSSADTTAPDGKDA